MVTHVLWDWNGTMIDDVDLVVDVMNGLLAAKGLPLLDRVRYRSSFGFPVRDYYARLGFGPEHGPFEDLARAFVDEYDRRAPGIPVRPHVRPLLARVRERGLGQIVLSAARDWHLRELIAHHDLGGYFDELLGLDDHYAHGKLDLARGWLDRTGHDPAGLLLIGDTLHDHEVAAGIGASCVLVADGHHDEGRLRGSGCTVVSDLAELYTADTPLRALLA